MTTIWHVDDDQEMLNAMDLMLSMIGFETRPFLRVRSAAEALLAGGKPDALLLDINMPEVSGLDMLEFVRRRAEWNTLPVIMLSTEAADVTVDHAMQLGADGYVTKPVTLEELKQEINNAITKRRS